MKNSIMVLGANGFIGSHLVKRLLSQNFVLGYDAIYTKAAIEHKNYCHIAGDYCSETNFVSILNEYHISKVYHLISTTTPQDGTKHVEIEIQQNVLPTIRLLEACAECNVERVIFPSSGGTVYGEGIGRPHLENERLRPICSYGVQKQTIESYLSIYHHMHNLRGLVARIANPYGPGVQAGRTQGVIPIMIRKLFQNEPIELYGESIRDYIYIDDVIDALIALLDYDGDESVFNIASGEGIGLSDLVNIIEETLGKRFSSVVKKEIRLCDVQNNCLDISMAEKELNWKPKVSLKDGITKMAQEVF